MTPPDELLKLCQKFIDDNTIFCPTAIYQSDWIGLNALDFIEQVCELVGYYKETDSV